MARPRRRSLDYFSIDCTLEDSVKLIEAEFGLTGFALWVKLLQRIYGGEGYFCQWSDEVALLFARENGVGGKVVSEVVSACLKRGIFSEDKFKQYGVLTSHGIQSRFLLAAERRKGFEIDPRYALVECADSVSAANLQQKPQLMHTETPVNVYGNATNQSKVNQSKVKESKENASKPPLGNSDPIFETDGLGGGELTLHTLDFIFSYSSSHGWPDAAQDNIIKTLTEQQGRDKDGNPIRNLTRYLDAWDAKFKTGFIF